MAISASLNLQNDKSLLFREHRIGEHTIKNFTGHSDLMQAPPAVDITAFSTLSVCSAAIVLVNKQTIDTTLNCLGKPDLCIMRVHGRDGRPFLNFNSMKYL